MCARTCVLAVVAVMMVTVAVVVCVWRVGVSAYMFVRVGGRWWWCVYVCADITTA